MTTDKGHKQGIVLEHGMSANLNPWKPERKNAPSAKIRRYLVSHCVAEVAIWVYILGFFESIALRIESNDLQRRSRQGLLLVLTFYETCSFEIVGI